MSKKETEVNEVLNCLLPAMEADGGGITSFYVNNDEVFVKFKGTCIQCPSINLTLKFGIEASLKKKLEWIKGVYKYE